jgi:hypothetical protein
MFWIENEKPVRVQRVLSRCDSMGTLTRGQNPSDLSAEMGVECRRSCGCLRDQAGIPRVTFRARSAQAVKVSQRGPNPLLLSKEMAWTPLCSQSAAASPLSPS